MKCGLNPTISCPREVEFLVHALVVPSPIPEEDAEQYDADVEAIAVEVATAYEERFNAQVTDVSRPELARRAGLTAWPGFDLLSRRPPTGSGLPEKLCIEVKGRRGHGSVQLEKNEWASACNNQDEYWLYCGLRLRHAPSPLGSGARSLRQTAGENAGVNGPYDNRIADFGSCGVGSQE